jgi:hypothetical protein
MVREIIEQGERRLAVPVGSTGRSAALGRILGLKGSPGWRVTRGGVREWRFEGVTQQGDEILLHGPWMQARPLDAAAAGPLAEALPFLARTVAALEQLREAGVDPFPVQTDAVLLAGAAEPDGPAAEDVLFLPPAILRELRALRPFEANRETFEAVNHPDLAGSAAASFTVAALVYRAATGRFPFAGDSQEEMHGQARSLQVPAPGLLVPELAPEVSALVMAGLSRSTSPAPGLAQWSQALAGWQARLPFREIAAAEKARLQGEAGILREGSERRFRRRESWRKHWKLVAVIAAAVIAVGIGAGSIISRALAPRPTAGFSARLVTEMFYRSTNSLDHQLMEACVADKAGREEIAEVTNLYVISRVTTAYEGRPGIISAEAWDRAGRPDPGPGMTVYGVTDLSLVEEAAAPSPVVRVDYVKWAPVAPAHDEESPAAEPKGPRFSATRRSDRVHLRRDRGDWVIVRIEKLAAEPVEPAP